MEPEYEEAELIDFQEFTEPEPEASEVDQPQRRRWLLIVAALAVVALGAVLILSSGSEDPVAPATPAKLSPEELQTVQAPPSKQAPAEQSSAQTPEEVVDRQINQLVAVLKAGDYPPQYRYQGVKLVNYLNQELPFPVRIGSASKPGVISITPLGYIGSVIVQGPPSDKGLTDIRSIPIWK